MPDFPGIAKAEKTENWDAGFPIDLQKIRPKDEQYWKQHRGTPKAFITLHAGQQMWSNQFGNLTAIRFSVPNLVGRRSVAASNQSLSIIQSSLLFHLDPAAEGLNIRPVRALALAASSQAEDLGQYFASFSIFIIAAALILLALLFQFGLEQRAHEIGVLLALGWRPRQVRRLLLLEGLILSSLGALLGVPLGLLYCRAILYGLAHFWGNAVNNTTLAFHVTAQTLATGAFSGLFVCALVIWFALRAQTKRPARDLLERGHELEPPPKRRRFAGFIALASALCGAATLGATIGRRQNSNAAAFFAAATLLLIAGIAATAFFFRRLEFTASASALALPSLGLRGCIRRRKRSLAAIALLACGCFLIVAVAANKLDATAGANLRSSGTGGFAFIAESALPVVQDLNTPAGRQFFGLENMLPPGLSFVPFRVHEGDDASCLNLNHAQTPRLLGVEPQQLAGRHAFTFSTAPPNGWLALTNFSNNDPIPAIADDASIQYSLHKSVGDTLDYTDEHGRSFKIRLVGALANSVLQGNVIISAAAFDRAFPSAAGAREFLIDCTPSSIPSASTAISRALQDRGFELTPASTRLNDFNAVQNAYLDTFEALGALGLLLGSAGLGAIVLRNVLERRAELAALSALGFRRSLLFRLLLLEHISLEFLGVLLGSATAALAVLPALLSPRAPLSSASLAAMLGLIALSGLIWTWLATRFALRGPLLNALHHE